MGQRPEAVSVSPRLLSVAVEKTHPGKLDPTVCTAVMHAAAAAARKGEMPFSWLPRRDKVWRQCAGPTARISMNAYGHIVASLLLEPRDPIVTLHPTSQRQPGSHTTYLHNTTRHLAGRPSRVCLVSSFTATRVHQDPPTRISATAVGPQSPYLLHDCLSSHLGGSFRGRSSFSFYFKVLGLLPFLRLIAPRLHRHPPSHISATARISRMVGVRSLSPARGNHWRRR